MTTGISLDLVDALFAALLSSTISAQLHTGDPGPAGLLELSVGDPSRHVLAFTEDAAHGALALASTVTWTNTGGSSETLTHLSLWHGTGGAAVFWASFPLASPSSVAWSPSNTYSLTSLPITLSPLAS